MKKIQLFLVMLLLSCLTVAAQNLTVTGKVTYADDGSPVAGATISVKGTSTAAMADMNGEYRITIPNGAEKILEFSFLGLKSVEIGVEKSGTLDVAMQSDNQQIDDVIVTAYGTSKRSTFTGSAAVVKSSQLTSFPTASFTKALQGAVAGVQVTGGKGQPGSDATITIRGVGSINASNKPLYVVDGAPYDGELSALNTDDIENISILKDASAAALYGARGANGVVMVTTKKGKIGKPVVTARLSLSASQRAIANYDRVSPNQYMEGMYTGYLNSLALSGKTLTDLSLGQIGALLSNPTAAQIANARGGLIKNLGGYNPYNVADGDIIGTNGKLNSAAALMYQDDWESALSRTGLIQDYSVNVSGGSESTQYMFSLGYLNEQGYIKHSDFERFNVRANVSTQVTSWFKATANISASSFQQAGPRAEGSYTINPFYYSTMMGPIYPIYQRTDKFDIKRDSKGEAIFDMGGGSSIYAWDNHTRPYAPNSNLVVTLPLDNRSFRTNQVSARVGGEIKFLKDFTFVVSGATDISNKYTTTYQNNKFGDAESVQGRSTKTYDLVNSMTFNQVLNYNKAIGSKHNVSALLGHESYMYKSNYASGTRVGYILDSDEMVAGSSAEGSTSYSNLYTMESYFAKAEYIFDNRLVASATVRTDGSSRFAPAVRWGTFYSVGASWRLSAESWMHGASSWLNDLRLKASYGEQGNDNIGTYYGYQNLYGLNNDNVDNFNNGSFNGVWLKQIGNPNLKWEKNTNINAGLEFRLFDRFYGSLEYFVRKSDNLLFDVPRPESIGIGSVTENVGSMQNNGFELSLGVDIIRTQDVLWSANLNFTTYKNKITKLPEVSRKDGIIKGTKKYMEGFSIYEFYLRDYAGVDPTSGSAMYYRAVKDADGKDTNERGELTHDYNKASRFFVGDALPTGYGGFNTSISAYGFDLAVALTYQIGGLMYDTNYADLMHTGSFGTHWSTDILKAWQKEGDITDVPRLQNSYLDASGTSSRWLTDASYLSLRNVTVGYSLPKNALSKIGLNKLRFYLSGENLALLSGRKGMDPQQSLAGVADQTYVPSRTFTFGINVTF